MITAFLQARLSSRRLPGKLSIFILGKLMIESLSPAIWKPSAAWVTGAARKGHQQINVASQNRVLVSYSEPNYFDVRLLTV